MSTSPPSPFWREPLKSFPTYKVSTFTSPSHPSPSHIANISTGIKFTHHDFYDFGLCVEFAGGAYDVLNGFEHVLLAGLAFGCSGGIGITFSLIGQHYEKISISFLFLASSCFHLTKVIYSKLSQQTMWRWQERSTREEFTSIRF